MAERRMFAKTIIDSDAFLDMPATSQLLYFHLSMRADDDGFINKPKSIMRMIGAKDDDLRVLISKNFIIPFETGIVVIKHWKIHNVIQKDRYKATVYTEEKMLLTEKETKAYTLKSNDIDVYGSETDCIQNGYRVETQVRLGKDRLGEDNIYNVPPEPIEEPAAAEDPIYKDVIEYLNLKAGTAYRASSRKTKSLINARISEGFSLEDFRKVIDKKTTEWRSDPKMSQYLRPETLFGTKFECYLNQKMTVSSTGTRFANYTQRDVDFAALEREVLAQSLGE